MDFLLQLARPIFMVAAVLILAFWASRRLGRGAGISRGKDRPLRVLDQTPCGTDQRLILLEWENRQFLVGAGPSGFVLLAEKSRGGEKETGEKGLEEQEEDG